VTEIGGNWSCELEDATPQVAAGARRYRQACPINFTRTIRIGYERCDVDIDGLPLICIGTRRTCVGRIVYIRNVNGYCARGGCRSHIVIDRIGKCSEAKEINGWRISDRAITIGCTDRAARARSDGHRLRNDSCFFIGVIASDIYRCTRFFNSNPRSDDTTVINCRRRIIYCAHRYGDCRGIRFWR
jgi:hypothetical protein